MASYGRFGLVRSCLGMLCKVWLGLVGLDKVRLGKFSISLSYFMGDEAEEALWRNRLRQSLLKWSIKTFLKVLVGCFA